LKKSLLVLFACLFVGMFGLGITMPVLPFYAERLALAGGASRAAVAFHVTALTSVYALTQLLFAPLWGQQSDRFGRRRLVLIGLLGSAVAQVLFGMATSLWLLYGAQIIGGVLSSVTLVVASAYIADQTTDEERGRGMAWLGTTVSLGVVVGLALGGLTTRKDLHLRGEFGHLRIDGFSIPFFLAATLMLLTFFAAMAWLPESLKLRSIPDANAVKATDWKESARKIGPLLGLSVAGHFGLAIFEATFALYAQVKLKYGPGQVGTAFMVCGLVMAVFQIIIVSALSRWVSERLQVATGFMLMGVGIALLSLVLVTPLVLGSIGILALGMAFIGPNLSALISKRGGQQKGTVLGMQNAANSLGQIGGPLAGGLLFAWRPEVPFVLSGTLLLGIGAWTGWKYKQRLPRP
jgi:DHA1 family multidrug resistance protein-like MFS transporter